jgi:hypothetical protein
MANEYHRRSAISQPANKVEHLRDLADRDRGGRLIHQHELRLRKTGPCDRHGLALAARHLLHQVVGTGLARQFSKQFGGPVVHRTMIEEAERANASRHLAAKKYICGRGQVL